MSSTLNVVITDAGIAEVINAQHTGTAPVVLTQIGFGRGIYTPTADQTALHDEIKRVSTIAGGVVGDNIMHIQALDEGEDSYAVYEIGVYTASGTLFAVYSQPMPILHKVANSSIMCVIDFVLSGVEPTDVTVGDTDYTLAPATTTNMGVVELATAAEAIAGTDTERAITPAAGAAAYIPAADAASFVTLADEQTITGKKAFHGAMEVKNFLKPVSGESVDIGDADKAFNGIYGTVHHAAEYRVDLSTQYSVYMDSSSFRTTASNYDIGTSTNRFRDAYFSGTLTAEAIASAGTATQFTKDIIPALPSATNCGHPSYPFAKGYFGEARVDTLIASTSIYPIPDNTVDLGTSSYSFKNLYLKGGIYGFPELSVSGNDAACSIGATLIIYINYGSGLSSQKSLSAGSIVKVGTNGVADIDVAEMHFSTSSFMFQATSKSLAGYQFKLLCDAVFEAGIAGGFALAACVGTAS